MRDDRGQTRERARRSAVSGNRFAVSFVALVVLFYALWYAGVMLAEAVGTAWLALAWGLALVTAALGIMGFRAACRRDRRRGQCLGAASLGLGALAGALLFPDVMVVDATDSISLIGVPGIALLGIVLGMGALAHTRETEVSRRRLSLGVVARVTGAWLLAAYLVLLLVVVVRLVGRRPPPSRRLMQCLANVGQLSEAMQLYLADNDSVLPPAPGWCEAIRPYFGVVYDSAFTDWSSCPRKPSLICGYAYNSALGGVASDAIRNPRGTVLLFESDLGWNGTGGLEALPRRTRHFCGDNYGFVDGHIEWVRRSRASTLVWRVVVKRDSQEGA